MSGNSAPPHFSRLNGTNVAHSCHVIEGDCNTEAEKLSSLIPESALTLAFIDPTGLHAEFETIRTITSSRRVDLLILFPDAVDIVRNIEVYRGQDPSNLDRFLGPESNWRERYDELGNQSGENARELFETIYQDQLGVQLGYKKFGRKIMRTRSGPIYRLIYASKHERGLEFWDKITRKDRGGQGQLF